MKQGKPRLTPSTQRILDEFDAAARAYSWAVDQGTGKTVVIAEQDYNKTKLALAKRLERLEAKIRSTKV